VYFIRNLLGLFPREEFDFE